MTQTKRFIFAVAIFAFLLASGCARISSDYGKTKGTSGRKSLNGFGALRSSYEQAGFRSRDVTRLSNRVLRTDVIVWTPQVFGSVDGKVTRWFDRWLRQGDHTLVYVVPDSGSEADYWRDAARLAAPEQRLEYRRRAAKSVNERTLWRLNRAPMQSNGWCRIEPLKSRHEIGKVDGPWKQDLGEVADEDEISVEFHLRAFDAEKNKAIKPAGFTTGPTGPGSPGWSIPSEISPTKTPLRYQQLVTTEAGDPIVARIRSKNWPRSQIIFVAGGSLLTNYAFTRSWNRSLAEQIIEESKPNGKSELKAGFLTSDWNQIPVSETKAGVPKATGMELLTVWPMSLVTMHGVMLGLVVCLMLLPIFGRPRRIERSKKSDFGHHLDAVAALMNKSGGEVYARNRISEYMKRMHGETSGPWVLPEPPATDAKPMPSLASHRFKPSGQNQGASNRTTAPANATQQTNRDESIETGEPASELKADEGSISAETSRSVEPTSPTKQETDKDEAES